MHLSARPLACGFAVCLASGIAAQSPSSYLETTKLVASDGATDDYFGVLSVEGDTMVVGASGADIGGNQLQGAAYVFERTGGDWTQVAQLIASNGKPDDRLGVSVAMSGDTLFVGATLANGVVPNTGAVYLYEKPASGWVDATETAVLIASDGQADAFLGRSMAIDGDTVVVGAPGSVVGGNDLEGAAYVFEKPVGGWVDMTQTAKFTQFAGAAFDWFGMSVAIEDRTIVVAAPFVDSPLNRGKVYVFNKPGPSWTNATESVTLVASNPGSFDEFGRSVSLCDDVLAIGAPGATGANALVSDKGVVYLFEKPAGGWMTTVEDHQLIPSGTADCDFGFSVDLNDDKIVAGAPGRSCQGRAYVFEKPASGWADATENSSLVASDGTGGALTFDSFGSTVAVSGETIGIGATKADIGGVADQGAVYVFEPPTVSLGCGLGPLKLSGSTRIGTRLSLSLTQCAGEGVLGILFGVPTPNPVGLSSLALCGDSSTCLLACVAVNVQPTTSLTITIENDPSLVGVPLCAQGLCVELPGPCLRATDLVTFVVSD